ncbi:MAG: peptide ABC transporter substrate-binding protein, partial [Planctomycetota bacterium]
MNARSALLPAALLLALTFSCEVEKSSSEVSPAVAEARLLLAEAGYPGGKGFPDVELLYNTSESHKKIAAIIQSMWKKGLGVEVALQNTEWKTYLARLSRLDYQIARRSWIADYNDPNTFLEMFTTGGGNNNTGWSSAEYDSLIEEANGEPDPAKRRGLLERAEAILMTQLPAFPIYYYVTQEMYRDTVKGWHQNSLAIHPLKDAYREDGKTLVLNNHAEVQALDPGIARGVMEYRVLIGLFEGLLNLDPKTLEPVPGAAERWDISEDGTTYTFHLRKCSWSDGKPVTAGDFEYAWKRALDPATAGDFAHQLYYLKGAKDFHSGKTKDRDSVGVRAKDERTLVVDLEAPCPFFLSLMSFFTYYPVRRDVIGKHGPTWTRAGRHVGNGPFLLKEWVTNDYILLEKNPHYWDAANVRQQQIKILPTEDVSTAFNLYRKGECDILTSVPLESVDELKERPDYHTGDYLATYFYSFNVTRRPFEYPRVRKAFALAIDR